MMDSEVHYVGRTQCRPALQTKVRACTWNGACNVGEHAATGLIQRRQLTLLWIRVHLLQCKRGDMTDVNDINSNGLLSDCPAFQVQGAWHLPWHTGC